MPRQLCIRAAIPARAESCLDFESGRRYGATGGRSKCRDSPAEKRSLDSLRSVRAPPLQASNPVGLRQRPPADSMFITTTCRRNGRRRVRANIPGTIAHMNWSVEGSLASMDGGGVETAILSTTNPGIWFGDDAQTKMLARNMNEFGAELVHKYKPRYGLFAVLPLPNAEACLPEIAYAFDTLHADGISVLSSYGISGWAIPPSMRCGPNWTGAKPSCSAMQRRRLAATSCSRISTTGRSIQYRYRALGHQHHRKRRRATLPEHPLRLVACRRNDSCAGRTLLPQAGDVCEPAWARSAGFAARTSTTFLLRFAGSANEMQMPASRRWWPPRIFCSARITRGTKRPTSPARAGRLALFYPAELRAIERDYSCIAAKVRVNQRCG